MTAEYQRVRELIVARKTALAEEVAHGIAKFLRTELSIYLSERQMEKLLIWAEEEKVG